MCNPAATTLLGDLEAHALLRSRTDGGSGTTRRNDKMRFFAADPLHYGGATRLRCCLPANHGAARSLGHRTYRASLAASASTWMSAPGRQPAQRDTDSRFQQSRSRHHPYPGPHQSWSFIQHAQMNGSDSPALTHRLGRDAPDLDRHPAIEGQRCGKRPRSSCLRRRLHSAETAGCSHQQIGCCSLGARDVNFAMRSARTRVS